MGLEGGGASSRGISVCSRLFFFLDTSKICDNWWNPRGRGEKKCKIVLDILQKPPGFHTTAREPKRAHLRVPALQTPPEFHEKTSQRRERKRAKMEVVEGNKDDIVGGARRVGPRRVGTLT